MLPDALGTGSGWPWDPEQTPRDIDAVMPRISVVTPVFNQVDTIEKTLRSVLLQGYQNLEYIVVDGGSTDGTVDVIRHYGSVLASWTSESDRGQSHAINKGFGAATGELVAWLNGDDYLLPGALPDVAAVFRETGADLIHGLTQMEDEHGQIIGERGGNFDLEEYMWRGRIPTAQQSAFFTADLLRRAGGLDESLHLAMAADLWIRFVTKGEQCFVPRLWSVFLRHPRTKTMGSPGELEEEKLLVASRYLGLPQLEHLHTRRREVRARALVLAARGYHSTGHSNRARWAYLRALWAHPRAARRRAGGLSKRFLLGPRTVTALKRLLRRRSPR